MLVGLEKVNVVFKVAGTVGALAVVRVELGKMVEMLGVGLGKVP